MRLAWLCYDEYGDVSITFAEPSRHTGWRKVVPIVYAEIVK